ncbi:glutamate--tRNA ligase, partial [candidate division KSB1 bacterium]
MIRIRFAPSPTGSLHVGNCRTAVLNWIFARHMKGKYILRIEDTDIERSTVESEAGILNDLKWLGLNWDEGPDISGECGPYRQSERLEIYKEKAEKLLEQGMAYRCFCTQEELDEEKDALLKKGLSPKYSGKCRELSEEKIKRLLNEKKSYSVRFQIQEKDIEINDLVMGTVTFKSDVLSDFIILRSNGRASYNFAVVVDDIMMEITHIIRGGDHLSNTPKQILLFDAFSQKPPVFAHIPMITAIDGTRLSKRDGAVSVKDYREMGILPETLINFLSLLSWSSPGGEEILSKEKLIEEFDFSRFSKSPAAFDMKKLLWMNGNYIRSYNREKLTELILHYFPDKNDEKIPDIVDIIYDNLEYLSQTPQRIEMFYVDKVIFDENT